MRVPNNRSGDNTRGGVSGPPAFSRVPRKRGYTIAELAVVASIIAVMSLTFSPVAGWILFGGSGSETAARAEAGNVARWMERTLQRACLHRRAFDVRYLSGFREELLIQWYNPAEYERYRTNGRCLVYFKSTVNQKKCYTPAWHTMTPAFTLYVFTPDKKKKVAEIAVSAYCGVNLTEIP